MSDKLKMLVIMPSEADMELIHQEGGKIALKPIFYGGECIGPHLVIMDGDKVIGRAKLRLKEDGKLELKKAQ